MLSTALPNVNSVITPSPSFPISESLQIPPGLPPLRPYGQVFAADSTLASPAGLFNSTRSSSIGWEPVRW